MVTITENRPRPITGAESEFDHASLPLSRPGIGATQSGQGSGNSIAYLIAVLVIAVGGYFLYTSYYGPTTIPAAVTQPSPPVAPAPAVDEPALTPPAAVPAAPPATTTTP
jgi:hypothetical protein